MAHRSGFCQTVWISVVFIHLTFTRLKCSNYCTEHYPNLCWTIPLLYIFVPARHLGISDCSVLTKYNVHPVRHLSDKHFSVRFFPPDNNTCALKTQWYSLWQCQNKVGEKGTAARWRGGWVGWRSPEESMHLFLFSDCRLFAHRVWKASFFFHLTYFSKQTLASSRGRRNSIIPSLFGFCRRRRQTDLDSYGWSVLPAGYLLFPFCVHVLVMRGVGHIAKGRHRSR